jgi:hypothetical protein
LVKREIAIIDPSANAFFIEAPNLDSPMYNARPMKKYPAVSVNTDAPYAKMEVEVK